MPPILEAIILPVLLAFSIAFFLFVCWAQGRRELRDDRGPGPHKDTAPLPEGDPGSD